MTYGYLSEALYRRKENFLEEHLPFLPPAIRADAKEVWEALTIEELHAHMLDVFRETKEKNDLLYAGSWRHVSPYDFADQFLLSLCLERAFPLKARLEAVLSDIPQIGKARQADLLENDKQKKMASAFLSWVSALDSLLSSPDSFSDWHDSFNVKTARNLRAWVYAYLPEEVASFYVPRVRMPARQG